MKILIFLFIPFFVYPNVSLAAKHTVAITNEDEESEDFKWVSGKEIRAECYEVTKSLENCKEGTRPCDKLKRICEKDIQPTDVFHRGILDSCLKHMTEDGRAPMDSDQPVAPRSMAVNIERYSTCVASIKNKSFSLPAFEICQLSDSFLGQAQCLDTIANNTYDNQALNLCLKAAYVDEAGGQKCLEVIQGKVLPPQAYVECAKQENPSSCVISAMNHANSSTAKAQNCEDQLAQVSALLDKLPQSANQQQSLKNLQNVVEEIKNSMGKSGRSSQ